MRREFLLGFAVLLASSVLIAGCTTGSPLGRMSPVQPLEAYEGEYSDIIIDTQTTPQPTLELTRDDVTVRVQYWRKADLDRKFNRGSSTSGFYYQASWKQGDKLDVFYVTIENRHKKPLRVLLSDFYIEDDLRLRPDMDGNIYIAVPAEENERRILYKKGQTLDVKNGLAVIKPLLLETNLRGGEVPAEGKVEGYLPFFSIKPNANKLWMHLPVQIPPESEIGRYQKIDFVFPLRFDRAIYEAQPATIRY